MLSDRAPRYAIYLRVAEASPKPCEPIAAQYVTCAEIVRQHAGEAWTGAAVLYADVGFSGVTLERPELRRLLRDVDAGCLDVVVVADVGRLSRSLVELARLMFDIRRRGADILVASSPPATLPPLLPRLTSLPRR